MHRKKCGKKRSRNCVSSFENFGLTYRFGTQRLLWRLQALSADEANSKAIVPALQYQQTTALAFLRFVSHLVLCIY